MILTPRIFTSWIFRYYNFFEINGFDFCNTFPHSCQLRPDCIAKSHPPERFVQDNWYDMASFYLCTLMMFHLKPSYPSIVYR